MWLIAWCAHTHENIPLTAMDIEDGELMRTQMPSLRPESFNASEQLSRS